MAKWAVFGDVLESGSIAKIRLFSEASRNTTLPVAPAVTVAVKVTVDRAVTEGADVAKVVVVELAVTI